LVYPETSLFFALEGLRRDGESFIYELYLRGLRNFVVHSELDLRDFPQANFILVENSLRALQKLAVFHRQQFDLPVIGITGSNGKTIVKEWLNQLLEDRFQIVRSPRSYNSQIGVPLSIWQISELHELALIEAGISKEGEMHFLQEIIKPDIGVLTNIGVAHDQGFANTDTKIREKLELFKEANVLIYPSDPFELQRIVLEWQVLHPALGLVSIGTGDNCTLRIISSDRQPGKTSVKLSYENNDFIVHIGFEDDASIQNAMTCIGVMLWIGIPPNDLQTRLNRLSPLAMRMEIKTGINHTSIINDSYSADISSLKIALDYLALQRQHNKRTLILSDILESGRTPLTLYSEVAALLSKYQIDHLIGVGEQISASSEIFKKARIPEIDFFQDTQNLISHIQGMEFRDETILLKGARIYGFEQIDQILTLQVHETQLEINLEVMAQNLKQYQQLLRPSTKIMAMVKAFSYGTGGFEIARLLEFHKVDYLAVAYADEGVALRRSGIRLPILVMNTEENALRQLLEWQLEPVIFSSRGLESLRRILKKEAITFFPIHIELETGMNRLGFSAAQIPELVLGLSGNSFRVQSVFSHLAASEEAQQDAFTQIQFDLYQSLTDRIYESLGYPFLRHISNSAAIVRNPSFQLDMVRLGIGLYGIDPASSALLELKGAGTLKTTIAQIKHLEVGETVGYNRRGVAYQVMKIATVRLGYADGYPRTLGYGNGKLLYRGRLVPTIGSICMDMTMIDITEISDAREGDEIIVFGDGLTVDELARWAGTNAYDILAGISQRVKRVYFE
jgi:alanine racemase